jgi:hypothetical protein
MKLFTASRLSCTLTVDYYGSTPMTRVQLYGCLSQTLKQTPLLDHSRKTITPECLQERCKPGPAPDRPPVCDCVKWGPSVIDVTTVGKGLESIIVDAKTGGQMGFMNYDIECPGKKNCKLCKGVVAAAKAIPHVGALIGFGIGELACLGC